jgi:hypothetical protein
MRALGSLPRPFNDKSIRHGMAGETPSWRGAKRRGNPRGGSPCKAMILRVSLLDCHEPLAFGKAVILRATLPDCHKAAPLATTAFPLSKAIAAKQSRKAWRPRPAFPTPRRCAPETFLSSVL